MGGWSVISASPSGSRGRTASSVSSSGVLSTPSTMSASSPSSSSSPFGSAGRLVVFVRWTLTLAVSGEGLRSVGGGVRGWDNALAVDKYR